MHNLRTLLTLMTSTEHQEGHVEYVKGIIADLEQRQRDLKEAETKPTSKDFYKYHLHQALKEVLG